MGRTLDEDDVLKEIDRWIGYLDEDMITRIKIGIKKLPSAQPEQRWISVSERLPDKEGNYLMTAQPTYNHAKDIRIAHWSGRWVGYVKSEIIAWMPLPEPYTEEGENE